MRFSQLHIENFRAISSFDARDLRSLVVIAGPNGCGKSCVFDAIRLLKSAYGGYQHNEWMQWFGEFQIDPSNPATFNALFRNRSNPVSISARLQLADSEVEYLTANAQSVLEPLVWAEVTNQPADNYGFSALGFIASYPQHAELVQQRTLERAAELRTALASTDHELSLVIPQGGGFSVQYSPVARALFQTYLPSTLGIVDFHSASRTYAREGVGGVNLDARAIEGQHRQQSLYNWQGKYQNVKSQLVTTYLRDLIAREGGAQPDQGKDLNETLAELFQTFFPDKKYLGVQPDVGGGLSFPVELLTGERHDLNDLSSGEKEVVYGYLRLRNSTPKHSTILIDEPELHLNPGLLRGFPDFYHRHVAQAQDNQVWLVTHSDALLRQSVGNPDYSVYHMTHATNVAPGGNQVTTVVDDELQSAMLDLVGDVAAYRPYAKVIIFEGEINKQFDVNMVSRLFPSLSERVNLVSGESKGRVQELYAALSRTARQVGLADRFYAVTDRDFDAVENIPSESHVLNWGVYHIENYLLSPRHMLIAIERVAAGHALSDEELLIRALKSQAEATVDGLVQRHLQKTVNDRLVRSVAIGGNPAAEPVQALLPSIKSSAERLTSVTAEVADEAWLTSIAQAHRDELTRTLDDGSWLVNFPARPVLKAFVHDHLQGVVAYDGFVNLVLSAMVEDQHQPPDMVAVLSQVVANP